MAKQPPKKNSSAQNMFFSTPKVQVPVNNKLPDTLKPKQSKPKTTSTPKKETPKRDDFAGGMVQSIKNLPRNADGDTKLENILEFAPLIGTVLSLDDIYRSSRDNGVFSGETLMEVAGALPLVGPLGKAAKLGKLGKGVAPLAMGFGLSAQDFVQDIANLGSKEKFLTGSKVGGMSPMGDPSKVLRQNQVNWDKAQYEAESNPFTMGLDFIAPYVGQVASGLSTKQQTKFQDMRKAQALAPIETSGLINPGNRGIDKAFKDIDLLREPFDLNNYRPDGTKKQMGWYGNINFDDEGVMSELSESSEIDGEEILYPLLSPGLSNDQIEYLRQHKDLGPDEKINSAIRKNAIDFALKRRGEGLSPFAELPEELGMHANAFQYPGMGYATGGQVTQQQVEVEGQEMFELPNGQVGKFTGPSHEMGGIPVTLPTGTDIYSKRLKGEDGKTMAKRKEARTKERKTLEDKMKKYPGDKLLKQTYERLVAAQDAIDHKDMQEMEAFKQLTESGLVEPNGKKFSNGGKITSRYADLLSTFKQFAGTINPIGDPIDLSTATIGGKPSVPTTTPIETTPTTTPTTTTEQTTQEATTNASRGSLLGGLGLDFTMGDGLGLIGNSMSALQPLQSARHAASMNTPNVNHYEGVGDRSLSKIESQKKFLDDFRTSAIQDILDRRATNMAQSRSSSRGVNQMRATDLAAYQSAEQSVSQADQAYLQQMMQATSQEAQFLQQQDSALAQARTQVDDLNRQDLASTLSEVAQAKQDVWKGLANTGKTLNQAKENRVQLDLLSQMSNQFGVDKNGKVYGKGSNLSDLDLDLFFRNGFGVEAALAKSKGYDVDLKPDGVYDKKTGKKLTITDLQK